MSLKVNQAERDQDHDGLRNRGEFVAGTDPRDADTDDDGVKDAAEDAGTVVSFDAATSRLVIRLFNGEQVTGAVTPDTEIECGDREEDHGGSHDHSGPGRGDGRVAEHGGGGGDDHGDDDGDAACALTSLSPGMVVREAELSTTPQGLVFDRIELVPTAPTQPVGEPGAERDDDR